MSFKASLEGTTQSDDLIPNNFVILFGQHGSRKSEILNILDKESLISKFIDGLKDQVRFIRVSMFYLD
jgi:hypothetical protein